MLCCIHRRSVCTALKNNSAFNQTRCTLSAFTEGRSALLLRIIACLIRHTAGLAAFTEGRSALLLGTIARLIRHAARFVAFTEEDAMDEVLDPLPEPHQGRITQTYSIHHDAKQYAFDHLFCSGVHQTHPGSRHIENLSVRLCAHHQSGSGQSRIVDGLVKKNNGTNDIRSAHYVPAL